MSVPEPHPCLFCLSDAACVLKFDKKGRPFQRCRFCSTTSFMPSALALRGHSLFAPAFMAGLRARINQVDKDLDRDAANLMRAGDAVAKAG